MKVGKEGRSERWREGGEMNVLKCVLCVCLCVKKRDRGGRRREKDGGRMIVCMWGGACYCVQSCPYGSHKATSSAGPPLLPF